MRHLIWKYEAGWLKFACWDDIHRKWLYTGFNPSYPIPCPGGRELKDEPPSSFVMTKIRPHWKGSTFKWNFGIGEVLLRNHGVPPQFQPNALIVCALVLDHLPRGGTRIKYQIYPSWAPEEKPMWKVLVHPEYVDLQEQAHQLIFAHEEK